MKNNDELLNALERQFTGKVLDAVSRTGIDFNVQPDVFVMRKHNHDSSITDMLMYWVVVKPRGGLDTDQLSTLSDALGRFCVNNDDEWYHAGRRWVLGDGDDTGAVTFYAGEFRIWLRGWK